MDPSAPEFAKPHPKQKSIWEQQCARPFNMANMTQYPAIGEEIEAWKQGIKIARRLARSVGMIAAVCVQDEGNNNDDNGNDGHPEGQSVSSCLDKDDQHNEANVGDGAYWFYRPFQSLGNTFRSNQDEDDEDLECLPTSCDKDNVSAGGPTISGKAALYQYSRIYVHFWKLPNL